MVFTRRESFNSLLKISTFQRICLLLRRNSITLLWLFSPYIVLIASPRAGFNIMPAERIFTTKIWKKLQNQMTRCLIQIFPILQRFTVLSLSVVWIILYDLESRWSSLQIKDCFDARGKHYEQKYLTTR